MSINQNGKTQYAGYAEWHEITKAGRTIQRGVVTTMHGPVYVSIGETLSLLRPLAELKTGTVYTFWYRGVWRVAETEPLSARFNAEYAALQFAQVVVEGAEIVDIDGITNVTIDGIIPNKKETETMTETLNETTENKAVLVCTQHRGVFFGYADGPTDGPNVQLKGARMAIYWGTKRGILELAEVGPNATSKISARADLGVRDVTMVAIVTPDAVTAWEAAL